VRIDVFTIFPAVVEAPLPGSLLGRAIGAGVVDVRVHDLRQWSVDRHRTVDDAPFGGGPGMVMKPEPFFAAVESLDPDRGRVLLMSPAGRRLDQELVRALSSEPHLTILCGRYEGVDERVVDGLPAEEISIGDYVLSGGELPALVLIEAVTRLVPGVIGKEASHEQDSFSAGGLSTIPTTRAHRSSAGWPFRRSSSRGTTARSTDGDATPRSRRPGGTGPI
jgi:tRNA (guanine37-N1)-methyltransferase